MKLEELKELALKLGIKAENFDYGMEVKPKETEKSIIDAATFMGLLKGVKK